MPRSEMDKDREVKFYAIGWDGEDGEKELECHDIWKAEGRLDGERLRELQVNVTMRTRDDVQALLHFLVGVKANLPEKQASGLQYSWKR